jgi:large subunit ribosomal protein L35
LRLTPLEKEYAVPKMKSHRGSSKRLKVTGTGKVRRHKSMKSHILTKKTTKRKRKLRQQVVTTGKTGQNIKEMLHG